MAMDSDASASHNGVGNEADHFFGVFQRRHAKVLPTKMVDHCAVEDERKKKYGRVEMTRVRMQVMKQCI